MKKQLAIGLAAVVGALGGAAFAGEEHEGEKPQLLCIYKEIVKPGMTQQYEAAIKYMVSEFKEYQIDPEKVYWRCISGPELGYAYVMPIDNFAGMDAMEANWKEATQIIGKEKMEEMMAPAAEAMESISIFHVMRRPDLSYHPEQTRLKPEEIEFIHYGFYYGIPGKAEDLENLAKEYAALYKAKGIDTPWTIYQSVTGSDLPVLVVTQGAKSAADFHTNRERIHELLGPEGKKLGEKVGATVRRIEFKDGMIRSDLSYPSTSMDKQAKGKYDSHEGHDHD